MNTHQQPSSLTKYLEFLCSPDAENMPDGTRLTNLIVAVQEYIKHSEAIRERVEGMEVRTGTIQEWYGNPQPITEDEACGYNKALDDILALLNHFEV